MPHEWVAAIVLCLQFTSLSDHRPGVILEGNWQSCREEDGEYGERIYDGHTPSIGDFELHLGPYREFALFQGIRETHRAHASELNLLQPYSVPFTGFVGKGHWEVLGLILMVTAAGGSREECESFWVLFQRGP